MNDDQKKFFVVAVAHTSKFQITYDPIYEIPLPKGSIEEMFESNKVSPLTLAKLLCGKKKKKETEKKYEERAFKFWEDQWKLAAENTMEFLQGYDNEVDEDAGYRWDVRLQKHERRVVKKHPLNRDVLTTRLQILWSFILSLPKNSLPAAIRKIISKKSNKFCFQAKDAFFKNDAWIVKKKLNGGGTEMQQFIHRLPYNLEWDKGTYDDYGEGIVQTILNYFKENNMDVEDVSTIAPEILKCWKYCANKLPIDYEVNEDSYGVEENKDTPKALYSIVCLKKHGKPIAAVWSQHWQSTGMFNFVDINHPMDSTLYIKACGADTLENERLAYLLQLFIIAKSKDNNFDSLLCSIPQMENGLPNIAASADLSYILGYQKCFGINDIKVKQYSQALQSPEIMDYLLADTPWNMKKRKMVSQSAKDLEHEWRFGELYMARKFPSEEDMQNSMKVLLCLLQQEENNLINGGYATKIEDEVNGGFSIFVENDDSSHISSMTDMEIKALQG